MIGALVGGVAAGAASYLGARKSAKAADRAVKRQIEWERERSQNAHQWEVEDLKKAGLNPILSAGGEGAVTGGISAPVPDTSGISGMGTAMAEAMQQSTNAQLNRAMAGKTGAEVANINADTENKNKQSALIEAQTEVQKGLVGLNSAKETWHKLQNIEQKVKSDNAKLAFWNEQVYKASNTAKNVADLSGYALKAMKNLLGDKKQLKNMFEGGEEAQFNMPITGI